MHGQCMTWLMRDACHACIIIAKSGANIAQTIADYKKNLDYCRRSHTFRACRGSSTVLAWTSIFFPGPPRSDPKAMSASCLLSATVERFKRSLEIYMPHHMGFIITLFCFDSSWLLVVPPDRSKINNHHKH